MRAAEPPSHQREPLSTTWSQRLTRLSRRPPVHLRLARSRDRLRERRCRAAHNACPFLCRVSDAGPRMVGAAHAKGRRPTGRGGCCRYRGLARGRSCIAGPADCLIALGPGCRCAGRLAPISIASIAPRNEVSSQGWTMIVVAGYVENSISLDLRNCDHDPFQRGVWEVRPGQRRCAPGRQACLLACTNGRLRRCRWSSVVTIPAVNRAGSVR